MRDEIIREARAWIGVRWRHQGRSRFGVDCVGLVIQAGRSIGVEFEDAPYPRRPDGTFLDGFRKRGREKAVRDAQPGDALVFVFGGAPCHIGILTWKEGQWHLVHAHAHRRKVVEEPLWAVRSLAGSPSHCFEYPGVE